MIERINEQVAYNPVRQHISIGFATVADPGQQIEVIINDLCEQGFDPVLSRVLIFVRTRKKAEELAVEIEKHLNENGFSWADKIGFFHAGMDSVDRETNYEDFQSGRKVIQEICRPCIF